jgi:hypothetical protein
LEGVVSFDSEELLQEVAIKSNPRLAIRIFFIKNLCAAKISTTVALLSRLGSILTQRNSEKTAAFFRSLKRCVAVPPCEIFFFSKSHAAYSAPCSLSLPKGCGFYSKR